MKLRETTRKIITQLEEKLGYFVQVVEDKNLPVPASFRIAHGLDVNSAEQKYTLKSMEGSFSGLHLVCLQYVAFKKIAPEHSIGFDLSAEYRTALQLFGEEQ